MHINTEAFVHLLRMQDGDFLGPQSSYLRRFPFDRTGQPLQLFRKQVHQFVRQFI